MVTGQMTGVENDPTRRVHHLLIKYESLRTTLTSQVYLVLQLIVKRKTLILTHTRQVLHRKTPLSNPFLYEVLQ